MKTTRQTLDEPGNRVLTNSPMATSRCVWLISLLIAISVGSIATWRVSGLWLPDSLRTPLFRASPTPLETFPDLVLWAWERPELLGFIDPHTTGVAFLARTLFLSGAEVLVRPRLQPLQVPAGTKLMAVVRIEVDRLRTPDLSPRQRELAVAAIVDGGHLPEVAALQVDFDAAVSQRAFYRALLHELRRRLPAGISLSMTALASWCLYDDWLADLTVDEVVPMVFRMGADQQRVRCYLDAEDFRTARCRQSVGIATDEPSPVVRSRRRLYVFHPQPWRPEALTRILEEAGRWPQ